MTPASIEEVVKPFIATSNAMIEPLVTLSVLFLLYGLYAIIFVLCMRVLRRRESTAHIIYPTSTVALFVLTTIFAVFEAFGVIRQSIIVYDAVRTRDYDALVDYLQYDRGAIVWLASKNLIGTLMNAFAEVMLVHRCYVVWGYKRFLLYAFTFTAFVVNGVRFATCIVATIGYTRNGITKPFGLLNETAEEIERGNDIAIALFHTILFLATAGRITWVVYRSRRLTDSYGKVTLPFYIERNFKGIYAIIVDSGMLYSLSLIAAAVLPIKIHLPFNGQIPFDFSVLSTLMAGLAPTLLVVKVAYLRPQREEQQMNSTFMVEEGNSSSVDTRKSVQLSASSEPINDEVDETPAACGKTTECSGTARDTPV